MSCCYQDCGLRILETTAEAVPVGVGGVCEAPRAMILCGKGQASSLPTATSPQGLREG